VGLSISEYFVNREALLPILVDSERLRLSEEIERAQRLPTPLDSIGVDAAFTRCAVSIIERERVQPLRKLLLEGIAHHGTLITEWTAFWIRAAEAYDRFDRGDSNARVEFSGMLSEFEHHRVVGNFSPRFVIAATTARLRLSGRSRLFLFGYVEESKPRETRIRPLLWGDAIARVETRAGEDELFVHHERIDEFARATEGPMRPWGRAAMRAVHERQVKDWFAEIADEPLVPTDWGGERSDLWTSRLHIDGRPVRVAFLLKGPGAGHPMTIRDLGRNGDQLDRLFTEPCDLVVVQHCDLVRPQIYSMLEAYARSARPMRQYCVIDGPATWRILKAYHKL
jgi:hypothetical protein